VGRGGVGVGKLVAAGNLDVRVTSCILLHVDKGILEIFYKV
jgi:hypothetical protein